MCFLLINSLYVHAMMNIAQMQITQVIILTIYIYIFVYIISIVYMYSSLYISRMYMFEDAFITKDDEKTYIFKCAHVEHDRRSSAHRKRDR